MSAPKGQFSVKSTMYPKGRARIVDGPWKPTVDEAIRAFGEMLVKKDLGKHLISSPSIAERADMATAPGKDSKGNYYRINAEATGSLKTKLAQLGFSV